MTPWAWRGGGGARLQLAGIRGWFPVWKGRGLQKGAGQQQTGTPLLSSLPLLPSLEKRAGRTAATKARLDTLCLEPPLQLAFPPGTPLILTSLSFFSLPGSQQGLGAAVGEENLSQQPERFNRSAEG